jgi:hypothetical protein
MKAIVFSGSIPIGLKYSRIRWSSHKRALKATKSKINGFLKAAGNCKMEDAFTNSFIWLLATFRNSPAAFMIVTGVSTVSIFIAAVIKQIYISGATK